MFGFRDSMVGALRRRAGVAFLMASSPLGLRVGKRTAWFAHKGIYIYILRIYTSIPFWRKCKDRLVLILLIKRTLYSRSGWYLVQDMHVVCMY